MLIDMHDLDINVALTTFKSVNSTRRVFSISKLRSGDIRSGITLQPDGKLTELYEDGYTNIKYKKKILTWYQFCLAS